MHITQYINRGSEAFPEVLPIYNYKGWCIYKLHTDSEYYQVCGIAGRPDLHYGYYPKSLKECEYLVNNELERREKCPQRK